MNISRGSLGFSLTLHCSLLSVGIIWLLLASPPSGAPLPPERIGKVKVTPIRLAEKPAVPKPVEKPDPVRKVQASVAKPVVSKATKPTEQPAVRPTAKPQRTEQPPSRPKADRVDLSPVLPLEPSYPKASTSPVLAQTVSRPEPSVKTVGRKTRDSSPPPLWQPEAEVQSVATDSEEPEAGTPPGALEGHGVVIEAYPLGRVDLATPKYMALKKVEIVAKFQIASDGSVEVILQPGTGIPEVDAEVLSYLKTVRWSPKTVGGIPTNDLQELSFSKDGR